MDDPGQQPYVGRALPRVEDARLLAGRGAFVGDLRVPGLLDVAFVRSTIPHGVIGTVDTGAARALAGVEAVVTAADLEGVCPVPDFLDWVSPIEAFPLARGKVRHVGEPVAAVVATDRYLAEDAAELVEVDIDPLPPVGSTADAAAPGAPLLYEGWGSNVLVDAPAAADAGLDRVFAAHRTVAGRFVVQRHGPVPIEPRGVVAEWRDERLTVWTSTQFPHITRGMLARVLRMPERSIRVIAPDVGGGFGGKAQVYAEEYVVAWLARHLGRPVRWLEDRSEHMVAACQARQLHVDLEGAFGDDGRLLAVRGEVVQDAGTGAVYPNGVSTAFVAGGASHGAYPHAHHAVGVRSYVTNKTPTGAYRGFGAPEGVFAIERLMDLAAAELGLDPCEIRRRNLLDQADLPYRSPGGARIDSGSHREAFELAVRLGTEARDRARAELAGSPRVRVGLGVVTYVLGTVPTYFAATGHWTSQDSAEIRFDPDGGVTVGVGIGAFGQGVATTVAAVAADSLGVAVESVRVVLNDSDLAPYGLGSWGSRGAAVSAASVAAAAGPIVEKGRAIAAHLLEAAPDDLEVAEGAFRVRGTPTRSVTWEAVATAALIRTLELPPDVSPGLDAGATFLPPHLDDVPDADGKLNAASTFANCAHACVVAVDTVTGVVSVLRYLVANDSGRVINPLLLRGQLHGGVAQGVGAALYEQFDYEDGVPVSTTFMDYLVPTAAEVPPIDVAVIETPAPDIPLGVKGVGEAGIVGPPAAIAQAVDDALRGLAAAPFLATPITPAAVLDAIATGAATAAAGASGGTP